MPELTELKHDERGYPIFPDYPKPVFPDGVVIYHGEAVCVSRLKDKKKDAPCRQKASFIADGGVLLCGVHARRTGAAQLPKNPNKLELIREKYRRERQAIEDAAAANLAAGRRGGLIATKLPTMRATEDHPGFMKVFPNGKHGERPDGLGCPSLAPIRLGPIYHDQPGLPLARSIESCWQSGRVYPSEVDEKGEPTEEWAATQLRMYNDPKPHRHKTTAIHPAKGKVDKPLYSIWVKPNGVRQKYDEIASRQFYCNFYERLATKPGSEAAADLESLRACLDAGYNLQIVGYDAYPVLNYGTEPILEWELLEKMYLDPTRPFGHELVLYTMLSLDDPEDYPWRRWKSEDF